MINQKLRCLANQLKRVLFFFERIFNFHSPFRLYSFFRFIYEIISVFVAFYFFFVFSHVCVCVRRFFCIIFIFILPSCIFCHLIANKNHLRRYCCHRRHCCYTTTVVVLVIVDVIIGIVNTIINSFVVNNVKMGSCMHYVRIQCVVKPLK